MQPNSADWQFKYLFLSVFQNVYLIFLQFTWLAPSPFPFSQPIFSISLWPNLFSSFAHKFPERTILDTWHKFATRIEVDLYWFVKPLGLRVHFCLLRGSARETEAISALKGESERVHCIAVKSSSIQIKNPTILIE